MRKFACNILWLMLLSGCEASQPDARNLSQDEGNTSSDKSDQPWMNYPAPGEYREMKSAAFNLFKYSYKEGYFYHEDDGFDVFDCGDKGGYELADMSDHQRELEEIALDIANLEYNLAASGYEKEVYEGPLEKYEKRAIYIWKMGESSIPDPLLFFPEIYPQDRRGNELRYLAAELEGRRAALQPNKPKIVADGGCGAGEKPYIFKSEPSGARIWFATKFSYYLCQAKNIDPWDIEKCQRWRENESAIPNELSGSYVYQVKWPDGRMIKGDKTLDPFSDEDDDSKAITITFRPDHG